MFELTALHGFNAFRTGTSYIKSIQNVAITIGSGSTSATATITAVTTGNTVIFYRGSDPAVGTNPTNSSGYLTLTNGTTVTALRQAGTASTTLTLYGTVVEFIASAVNVSAQYVAITMSSTVTSNTATITSVNTSNASIFYLGSLSSVASLTANYLNNVALTNSTTVTATRFGSASFVTVSACIIEWTAAVVKSSQHRAATISNASATGTDTIASVATDNAILLPGGAYINANGYNNGSCYLGLTNATTVTMTRAGTSTLLNVAYDVLEFQSGVLNQPVQRGTIALNNVTSNTATITSVNAANSVANFCAFTTVDSAASTMNKTTVNVSLTNGTTVTAAMDTADTNALTAAYEVAEFT